MPQFATTVDEVQYLRDRYTRLRAAAQKVYDGLNARLDYAAANDLPHPLFDGIADLHDELGKD
jgi:hypothetical protein